MPNFYTAEWDTMDDFERQYNSKEAEDFRAFVADKDIVYELTILTVENEDTGASRKHKKVSVVWHVGIPFTCL